MYLIWFEVYKTWIDFKNNTTCSILQFLKSICMLFFFFFFFFTVSHTISLLFAIWNVRLSLRKSDVTLLEQHFDYGLDIINVDSEMCYLDPWFSTVIWLNYIWNDTDPAWHYYYINICQRNQRLRKPEKRFAYIHTIESTWKLRYIQYTQFWSRF